MGKEFAVVGRAAVAGFFDTCELLDTKETRAELVRQRLAVVGNSEGERWDAVTTELDRAGWAFALEEYTADGAVYVTLQAQEPEDLGGEQHCWIGMGPPLVQGGEGSDAIWPGPVAAMKQLLEARGYVVHDVAGGEWRQQLGRHRGEGPRDDERTQQEVLSG